MHIKNTKAVIKRAGLPDQVIDLTQLSKKTPVLHTISQSQDSSFFEYPDFEEETCPDCELSYNNCICELEEDRYNSEFNMNNECKCDICTCQDDRAKTDYLTVIEVIDGNGTIIDYHISELMDENKTIVKGYISNVEKDEQINVYRLKKPDFSFKK